MDLIIDKYSIKTPIINILKQLKSELSNGKLSDIIEKQDSIMVTCPHHNGGHEKHPACGVYKGASDSTNSLDLPPGFAHCFACGFKGDLPHFIGECFDMDYKFGKEWLLARFGNSLAINENLEPLKKITKKEPPKYLNESILDKFQDYHPYMTARKLTPEVIKKFKIKYDPDTRSIVFPVWDENNHLIMLTKRSVDIKHFYIDKEIQKPIYLFNYFKNQNTVYVCESQINCLTLIGYGLSSIALFGTGSYHQYPILKKSSINHYILALDPDDAGKRGILRFIDNMPKDVFIDILEIPKGKDVNDLTKEEFDSLKPISSYDWLEKNRNILKNLK